MADELTCYTCKQEITGASTNTYIEEGDRSQLISSLHPECWNRIVQYLEEQRQEWDNAVQVQTEKLHANIQL